MTGATGSFLPPRFPTATAYQGTVFRGMRPQTTSGQMSDDRQMHHVLVGLNAEDVIPQLKFANLRSIHFVQSDLRHKNSPLLSQRLRLGPLLGLLFLHLFDGAFNDQIRFPNARYRTFDQEQIFFRI